MSTMDTTNTGSRLLPSAAARQSVAEDLGRHLARLAGQPGVSVPVEPGIEHPLRAIAGADRLVAEILDVTSASEPGTVTLAHARGRRLVAVVVHGDTWSLVLRPDQHRNPSRLARTATTWLFHDEYRDEQDLPLAFCFDGDESLPGMWTAMVAEVLGLLDQRAVRRGRTRGGRAPGPTPGPTVDPGRVPNWAGEGR